MTTIVIDASMAAAWTLDDEKSAEGEKLLDEIEDFLRIAPPIFWYEYSNILVVNQKKGRIREDAIAHLLKGMRSPGIKSRRFNNHQTVISLARKKPFWQAMIRNYYRRHAHTASADARRWEVSGKKTDHPIQRLNK